MVCRVLGEMGNDQALTLLSDQLEAADPARRLSAALALTRADPKDECGFLAEYLEHETDRLARLKVESALNPIAREH
jgi:HEAT repeat protein